MTEERVQRRLAAILAADVAGYSRLVGADETGTLLAMRTVWGEHFHPAVERHGGRVFKTMGDGALAEFGSAVEAVAAALDIQTAMAAFNAGRPDAPPIAFRIGINLGDIVVEGGDVLGDGVNVAARLEPLAPVGGVLLSDAVHAQVRGKVAVGFGDGGEVALKNIAGPVRVWHWPADAQLAAAARPADEQPSVAVLPFANMSGDADQTYFSDGISEDIITDLSKIAGLMVVARNSSFAYRGRTADIRVVGRELGVRSVLEGSIRRAGNRVRITAQLVDTRTGHHLWADRFDRDLTDIFAVQDEVTFRIVDALRVTLRPAERARVVGRGTTSLGAHDSLLRARDGWPDLFRIPGGGRPVFERIMAQLDAALAQDPGYAQAVAYKAILFTVENSNRWTAMPDPIGQAEALAARAIALDPEEPLAHNAMAIVQINRKDLDRAQACAERAIALNPNFANGFGTLGHILVYRGSPLDAVPHLEHAIRLDPLFSQQYTHFLGLAYLIAGEYRRAAEVFRERIRLAPTTDFSRVFLAVALGHLGEAAAARAVWAELRQVNPAYSFAAHMDRLPISAPDAARIAAGLAAAGIAADAPG